MQYEFPLDLTGTAASNLIKGEPQVITELNGSFSQIIIPDYAPFYLDNLKLTHISPDGTLTVLTKDVDFFVAYPYQDMARETGKMTYGAIVVIRKDAKNRFSLDYQTVGDKWTANPDHVKANLLEKIYNPRQAYWDTITNIQDKFPPQQHNHDVTESDRWPALIEAINNVTRAIIERDYSESSIYPTVVTYMDMMLPKMVTTEYLGLQEVENLPVVSEEEIQQRTSVRKYSTFDTVLKIIKEDVTLPNDLKFQSLEAAIGAIRETMTQADLNLGSLSEGYEQRFEDIRISIEAMVNTIASLQQRINQLAEDMRITATNTEQAMIRIQDTIELAAQASTAAVAASNEAVSKVTVLETKVTENAQNTDLIVETIRRNNLPSPFTYFLSQ